MKFLLYNSGKIKLKNNGINTIPAAAGEGMPKKVLEGEVKFSILNLASLKAAQIM
tara:strand:+ start:363 stop:527 length:165 start_codon:yes stop_codon:yes gene_type:complete